MLIYIKVLLQVVAVVSAAVTSTLDYKWHDKRTLRFKQARNLLFVLTALLLVGSVITTVVDDMNNNQKEKELRDNLSKVQEQNDGLQKGVAVLSDKSTNILEEQRGSFVSVLEDQRKIGLDTAGKIKNSSDLLQSGMLNSITKQEHLLGQQKNYLK